jgi:hypothetical protein
LYVDKASVRSSVFRFFIVSDFTISSKRVITRKENPMDCYSFRLSVAWLDLLMGKYYLDSYLAESCRVRLFHTLYPNLQWFLSPWHTLPYSTVSHPYPTLRSVYHCPTLTYSVLPLLYPRICETFSHTPP